MPLNRFHDRTLNRVGQLVPGIHNSLKIGGDCAGFCAACFRMPLFSR